MRKWYWFGGLKMLAVIAVMLACASTGYSQQFKYLPTLTLVKSIAENGPNNPNDVTASDTQYVAEAGPGEKRYFLMPVFIKNILDSVNNPNTGLTGEPIYSFRFKLQYNKTLLRARGVQKRGILPNDTHCVAKNFNLSWDIDDDATFKTQTIGTPSANGERILITGSSSIPLPLPLKATAPPGNTDPIFRDTAVFLYVLFEVVGESQLGAGIGNRDQVIITNDTLEWNNYRANNALDPNAQVPQFMVNRGFNPDPRNNQGIFPTPLLPLTFGPTGNNYGSAVVVITQRPLIQLFPPGQVDLINPTNPSLYELTAPLQTQYGNGNYVFRNLLLRNATPGTFLRDVTIETDQPWLRIDLNNPLVPPGVQQGGTGNDRGVFIRDVPNSQVNMNIVANPSLLPNTDGNGYPTPGLYIGYVTVRSSEALNSAVRLRVDLIVNRNPSEPTLTFPPENTSPQGIRLLFRNSAPKPDTTYLTFGTGVGATNGIDTLFGETEAATPPTPGTFYARFFPQALDTASNPPFNGLIDTRGVGGNLPPKPTNGENSLDIRDFKTNTTLIYCVKFGGGAPQNYPLIIEYDTRDFPNGAQLFVRDGLNGRGVSTNLRQATSLGQTRRYFTISDPNVNGFCIEYTVPSVTQFPEVNTGWNLVSLPVAPSDARASVVFPNIASGKPFRFTNNQYVGDDTVRVGVGYFVKYGKVVDRTVAGTRVSEIHELNTPYEVRLYRGWNTVGGLSVMTTVDFINGYGMSFGPVNAIFPTRNAEVYRYVTDRGYEQASLIVPGYGYWLKVDNDGYYRLSAPPSAFKMTAPKTPDYQALNRLTISDNSQKVGTLYFGQSANEINNSQFELPPAPMADMFDVRFDNNGFVSASKDAASERIVNIQGVSYPVVLSVGKADANYTLTDAVTGAVVGTFKQGEMGTVTINNPATKAVKIVGVYSNQMNLGAAFPNPATSKLSFNFTVPTAQQVSVVLYSALGAEVARLFDGNANGTQSVEFATDGLPSGVYYYKMTTGDYAQVRQVVISK